MANNRNAGAEEKLSAAIPSQIDMEKALIQEMITIASNPDLIDKAILTRGSLTKADGESVTLSDYYRDSTGIAIEARIQKSKNGYEGIANETLKNMDLNDIVVLDAIKFLAESNLGDKILNQHLKSYGFNDEKELFAAKSNDGRFGKKDLDTIAIELSEIKDKFITPASNQILSQITIFQSKVAEVGVTDKTISSLKEIQQLEEKKIEENSAIGILTILNQSLQLSDAYHELSNKRLSRRHSHDGQFAELTEKINSICYDNNLSPVKKAQDLIQFLEREYSDKFDEYKPAKKLFSTHSAKTPEGFVDLLNDKQKDHHFTRMVGLLLKEAYKLNPGEDKFRLDKLKIPDNEIYKNIFAQPEPTKTHTPG